MTANKYLTPLLKISILVIFSLIFLFASWVGLFRGFSNASAQSGTIFPEGKDFATLEMRDPWDMSEFTDVSQYLNLSGQVAYLDDIKVKDGLFSAKSTSLKDAQFFALWPGYDTAMLIDQVGGRYPINSGDYSCLYLGMKVDTSLYYDQFQLMWFENEKLNGGTWGYSKFIRLYPEAVSGTPSHSWRLYKVDLASSGNHMGGTPWTGRNQWRGLRIDPTHEAGVPFAIDWIRLTNCQPVIHKITWSGSQDVSIWIRPQNTTRDILVEFNVQGNAYDLDLQGLPPGSYTYFVKQGTSVIKSGDFTINQTPVVKFARPSFVSGADYAAQSGNPWDFSDSSDVSKINDMDYSFDGGLLKLDTPPGTTWDPIVELNSPNLISKSSEYRYLTFRMYTAGSVQNVPEGMIARWVWRIPGSSGRPGYECHLVSHDIPFDVGWKSYTIDLKHFFNGYAEETAGECSGLPRHWLETSPVTRMRFDPNETIMDHPIHQEIDWIKLTKPDQVVRGQAFPIQISLNKNPEDISKVTFYYTDDLNQPKKYPADPLIQTTYTAAMEEVASPQSETEEFTVKTRIFLPMSLRKYAELSFLPVNNGVNFGWDTSSVPPGEYYICASVEDDYNQATFCSQAAMVVLAP